MQGNDESEPIEGIQGGVPPGGDVAQRDVAHERRGHKAEVDERRVALHGTHSTGRLIREAAGAVPADEYILIQEVDRETRSVGLDEQVELRDGERLRFRTFRDDRLFTFTLDERGFEWGSGSIAAAALRAIAQIPEDFELVVGHEAGAAIPDGGEIALNQSHVPVRLFTRRREPELITIIVNGRPRQVKGPKVSFEQVVALAFPAPPPGTDVQYTVQYMRGPGHKPSGTLIEGQSVKIKDGEEFDVTPTNRS